MLAFGGFQLGGLPLALPMAALREVVPCTDLQPLACPAACVIGGVALRGVLVPVVDLRLALGRPASAPAAGSCVIVMVEGGCILGLLADGVSGVFSAAAASVSRMQPPPLGPGDDAAAAVLAGTVRADAHSPPAMLLSPAALARLPQVPLVVDPEPQRQHSHAANSLAAAAAATVAAAATAATAATAAARPVMLARCDRVLLAIDAMGVHTTLAHPQVRPSPLAMGHCRGVIEHGGAVPLVDLLALCGLGRSDLSGAFQAFLVRSGDGLVAFAVDAVIDVVRVADAAVVPVPRFALPCPALFAGALPMTALPPEVAERAGAPAQQFLVLDAQALKVHADVAGLAATSRPQGGDGARSLALSASGAANASASGRPLRNLLTYMLAGETATPIEQISEILPYQAETSAFGSGGALQGMVMNRGRSIPLLCLSQLHGLPPPRHGADASVLVVASDGEHLGFIVPQLRSIEPGEWPVVDGPPGQAAAAGGPLDTRNLARLAQASGQRLLPVLDLHALARRLQSPADLHVA